MRKAALPAVLTAGALILGGAASAQTPLVKDSPFAGAGTLPSATAAAEPYQLTGVVTAGENSRVCIYEAKSQHSHWISVGTGADGIQVLSYEADQKQAVISVDGARQTLHLRESPTSAAAAAATTPEAKAREARLLTGDLLDVGLQQRQAYAKAHSAAGN
jgi:hypothetical protein